jgi:hypothetical protein
VAEIFTKFSAKNLVYRKKSAIGHGQFSKFKDFNEKSKLHALERFFSGGGGGGAATKILTQGFVVRLYGIKEGFV